MGVLKEEDLGALRDAFRRLESAVSVSDPVVQERDLHLVRQLDDATDDLAALLASRLRAFQLAISAWQGPEPRR